MDNQNKLINKLDNQQGPTVQHKELYSMLCGGLDRRGVSGRMDTCIRMAELLCYSPETTTILLISYTPIENKKLKKKKAEHNYHNLIFPLDPWAV